MTRKNTKTNRRTFLAQMGATATAVLVSTGIKPVNAREDLRANKSLKFEVYDVFSAKRLKGNQLAVFRDARGLSDKQLQEIASEMNYSETTFVYPDDNGLYTNPVRTRIFTPFMELPFAGHPTLGTATAIRQWRDNADQVILQLDVGEIPINFEAEENGFVGTMSQIDPMFSDIHSAAEIAQIIGLDVSDVDMSIPPQSATTGLSRILIMLKNIDAVRRMKVDYEKLDRWNEGKEFHSRNVYAMTREVETGADFRARMQLRGLRDDPVTGSSGGAAIAWLVRHGMVPSGETVTIEQGLEINRGGEMYVSARLENDKVTDVRVGGRAVRSIEGTLEM
jgi:trans-2,3-dihydro-3-hydroxyanthranilate isomerase